MPAQARTVWLRLYRGVILLLVLWLIRQQAHWLDQQLVSPVTLRQARKFLPTAERMQCRDPVRGLYSALNARGDAVGVLLTTSPFTDDIIGYSGPSDVLVALNRDGAIIGLEVLRSGDTPEYVRQVRANPGFLPKLLGWKSSEHSMPKVDAVSGATLTSLAMLESIQRRLLGSAPSLRFPEAIALAEVQTLFPNAAHLVSDQQRWRVVDGSGQSLGYVLRTSPQADNVAGYRGPTDCLIALDRDGGKVLGLDIRRSYDTGSYVDQVRRAGAFLKFFAARTVKELAELEMPKNTIDGISGATMTARAIVEGTRRRAAAEWRRPPATPWLKAHDWELAAVVAVALVFSFTSLRGHRWARVAWQIVLVGYVGLMHRDFLSLALIGGWAANGLALQAAPGLFLLAAASFMIPWATRRQVYCHHLCPHGAAQQLLGAAGGRLREAWRRRLGPARDVDSPDRPAASVAKMGPGARPKRRYLELLPFGLLIAAAVTLLLHRGTSLAAWEPFDAWAWRTAGTATLIIAIVGLAASPFVSLPYCRFGCPTGALLSFARSPGSSDRWSPRDWAALAVALFSFLTVAAVRAWPVRPVEPALVGLQGNALGTIWAVKVRDEVADPAALEKLVAREFDWAESMTSQWRTNTDLAEFNRAASTNATPMPWPVLTLARWAAEISGATGGAYDITAAPLLALWGWEPGGPALKEPSLAEVAAARAKVGWRKLELLDGMIRKQTPELQITLTSIAQGWSIDHVVQLLNRRGYSNVLVKVGGALRVSGTWQIGLESPRRTCSLTNEAVATSSASRPPPPAWPNRPVQLIDPRTGFPVQHSTIAVSVRHPDCAHAQAWATALNILGRDSGLPLADRLGLAAQFVVQGPGGALSVTGTRAWNRNEPPQGTASGAPR